MRENQLANFFSMMEEQIILVDKDDTETGISDKLTVHREGLLHRAFSIFIFDSQNRFLLQKRSFEKYHSAGLWSNTCCGHPRPGEEMDSAAKRRLFEEMGVINVELEFLFKFKYKVTLDSGFTEQELDHVYVGRADVNPVVNPDEVAEFSWQSSHEIEERMKADPDAFTFWFRLIFDDVKKRRNSN